jgi:UDP-N-acetylmuramoylalanine--D-glutamate ligase
MTRPLPASALVLGLARQGTAVAEALERRGVRVVRADRELGNDGDLTLLDGVDVLVKSGGVPSEAPLAAAAAARGIPIWSDVEVGARILPNPILGVTGTNGKTTTTALLAEMLDAPAAGNIGLALCALDGEVGPEQWIVCELSSFQLEHVHTFRPRIAVLLNLEPDHLDRHGSFERYRDAKLRVFANQLHDDVAIVPRGFGAIAGDAHRIEFAGGDPLPAEPSIPGAHNRENASAATAAARAAGADDAMIARALRAFTGVPHRLELVAERSGVRFVNDSKATNVAAALRALVSYDAPVLLIAGGRGKGESYAPLGEAARGRVRRAYLIGESAAEVARSFRDVPYELSGDLESAVRAAAAEARPGEVVLLSPAAASYDQFRDFEERGDDFRRLAREVAG